MSTFATAIFSLPNHSYCMASFDVSSLFANLPLDECIDHCVYQLFANRDITEHNSCNYDKVSLRKLLSFADKHNNFLFDGRLYDQTDGRLWVPHWDPTRLLYLCVHWRNSLIIVLRSSSLSFSVVVVI